MKKVTVLQPKQQCRGNIEIMTILLLLFLLGVSATEQDVAPTIKEHPSSVVTRRNDPATLNCAASGASRITWYRDGEEVTTSSQDYRSHRVLLPSGSLFFLRVSNGRRDSDAGTYWCVASNQFGSTRSNNATLIIATLAYDFQGESEPLVKAKVGDSITLPCGPPKGSPKPEITWLRDNQEVTNSSRIMVTEDGDLIINKAVREDSATYICRAQNVAGTRESKPTKLTIMMPPWFEEKPGNLTSVSGVVVELACKARGSPSPVVTWRRLDGKMPLGRATIEDQRLILQQVSAQDSGVYVCEVESEAGVASASATLTVVDAPKLIQRPQDYLVLTGESVQLSCSVEGDPSPLLLWRLPTETRSTLLIPNQSNGHASVSENGQNLYLNKTTTEDTGAYKCWGVSSGGGVSAQAQVIVVETHPPPVIGVGPKDQTVPPGSTVAFPCEAVYEMDSTSLSWWFRPAAHLPARQLIEESDKPKLSIAENGALILKDVGVDEAGIYKCVVEAVTGKIEQEAILRVVKDAIKVTLPHLPAPPSKPRVMAINDTSVHLTWLPNSHVVNTSSQGYVVEHWRKGWEEWRMADAVITQESCIVSHLTSGETYTFLIRAVNISGSSFPSPWSDPITTRSPQDPRITIDQARHAQRRLSRSILTLTNASVVTPDSVLLKWEFLTPVEEAVEGVLAYAVAATGNIQLTTILGAASSHTIKDLLPNAHYTFFLVPFWRNLEGTPSNSFSLATPEDAPVSAPKDVRVTLREDGSTLITWTPLTIQEARGKVIGYHVTLTHNGTHITETVPGSWLEARGLTSGRLYTVRVAAITGAGHGPFSAPLLMDAGPGNTQTQQDVYAVNNGDDPSVLYAQPQTAWLIYLLIPLVIVMFVATLLYIRKLHQKTPPLTQHPPPPSVYQDPSIYPAQHSVNMYSEQKLWRPEGNTDSSLSSTLPRCPDQLANEYAEPRVQQANEAAEPYATTALLVPASPRLGHGGYWRRPQNDPNTQVNWAAYIPPPPPCPPPQNPIHDHPHNCRMCITASQYDNVGASQQYNRPCDAASEHTYEAYSQVAPTDGTRDRFHTFNSLQAKGRQRACSDCQSSANRNPPHSNTH